MLSETPRLRWFEANPHCRCGKKSDGILRGDGNESYGPHCRKCAERRLRQSKLVRGQIAKQDGSRSGLPDLGEVQP
jgi:hypothetical protein